MRRSLFALALLGLVLSLSLESAGQGKKKKDTAPPAGSNDPKHDPAKAVANLDVHPELEATLFASEPMITNPTNLDIDHRGRVWICDVKNYRGNNNSRPEGDRILILEDTNGDGKADNVKTFYQGRDVDTAMGICVLGNQVIVSATPNILVFTFDPATDKILKKEALFTKVGQPQHDHSAHSFLFGPDGKLYWNFGNTGKSVHDKFGKQVVDLAGNPVVDNGKPYFGGMIFRCNTDGSHFETLAHNFRNNYETTIDSFGTLWQSDNDDDGNRGVRINFVMEFGNYGYRDEITGASWQTKRTNLESEIPLRHWHLNDPGVVPNLLQTGSGSPTGICVYEGNLLPKIFHNQVIHCDAGPSIVRAYPATPDGAGYQATIVNILDGSKKNNWFRPADVCVAPDGSLFVTDWYDPGVGGHQQRDLDRGRIFRVAPPKTNYTVPKFNFERIPDLIEALKNPNLAVRFLAFSKLKDHGALAVPALQELAQSKVPHEAARALWLLGNIPGQGEAAVQAALQHADPNLRIVGLRLARERKHDLIPLVRTLSQDKNPAVLRECAIALRHHPSSEAPILWAALARKYDGKDRWFLEALGIGADKQWDAYLNAYLQNGPTQTLLSKTTRDIVWRSRASETPKLLAQAIQEKNVPAEELPRLFRAFDFQPASPLKEEVLANLAFGTTSENAARQNLVTSEAIARLKGFDAKSNTKAAAALNRILDATRGTPTYVELIARFNVGDRYPELLALAIKAPNDQVGVDALRLLLERDQNALIQKGLDVKDAPARLNLLQALANAAHPKSLGLLVPIIKNGEGDLETRRQATRALAKTKLGAQMLLKLAGAKQLPMELHAAASSVLHQSSFKDIKQDADKLFPLPSAKDNAPVPAISDLVKIKGNAAKGREIFAKAGTCANCHVINGEGKEVGPNLSEIGKKLAREALFESILYPSASISHNFETWVLETRKGEVLQGLLVSQTPDEVVLKESTGLTRNLKRNDVEQLAKSPVSLMPADLLKNLTSQDLADVVEFLLTLKEAKK